MPRIVGVDIPRDKKIRVALRAVYGIGAFNSRRILSETRVNPDTRAKDLTDEEVSRLTQAIQSGYKVEGDLRREIAGNVKRLMDIGAYRGLRHKRGLPARGQRTRTNARTRKGPRARVGVRKRSRPPV